jgi:hypothetical protein
MTDLTHLSKEKTMTATVTPTVATCRSRSRFGCCGRPQQHDGPHAVPIGDGMSYGYRRGGGALGYGHFHGDEFCQASHDDSEAAAQ